MDKITSQHISNLSTLAWSERNESRINYAESCDAGIAALRSIGPLEEERDALRAKNDKLREWAEAWEEHYEYVADNRFIEYDIFIDALNGSMEWPPGYEEKGEKAE